MTLYENLSEQTVIGFNIFYLIDFGRSIDSDFKGTFNFSSSGSNTLQNTNNLKTQVINNFSYSSDDYFSDIGFKNNFNLYFKNFNALAKNDAIYKSNLQSELMSIFEVSSSLL